MPTFAWKGRDARGELLSGKSEGASADAIVAELRSRGVTPLEIKSAKADRAKATFDLSEFFKEKVKHTDILLFSRQIYSLLKAGVPIMRALAGLQESSSSKPMKALLQVLSRLLSRKFLSVITQRVN